jgi:hypothetical protein
MSGDDLNDFFSKKSKKKSKKKKSKKKNALEMLGDLDVIEVQSSMDSQLSVAEYREKKAREVAKRATDTKSWGHEETYTKIATASVAMGDMDQMAAAEASADATASERMDKEAAKAEFLNVQLRRAQRLREEAAAAEAAVGAAPAPVEKVGWRARSIARERGATNVKPKLESQFDFPELAPSGAGGSAPAAPAAAGAAAGKSNAWGALQAAAEEKLDAQGYVIPFIPSAQWAGVKKGYYYGTKGNPPHAATGYYIDPLNPPTASGEEGEGAAAGSAAPTEEEDELARFAKKKKKKVRRPRCTYAPRPHAPTTLTHTRSCSLLLRPNDRIATCRRRRCLRTTMRRMPPRRRRRRALRRRRRRRRRRRSSTTRTTSERLRSTLRARGGTNLHSRTFT